MQRQWSLVGGMAGTFRKAKVQCSDYKVIHRLTDAFKYLECVC